MTQLPRNQKLSAATISGHSTRASSPALGSPGGSHQPERALPPLPRSLPANDSRNSWVESTLQQVATLALTCTLGLFLALVFLDVIITEVETPVLWPALAWLKPAVDRFLFLFIYFSCSRFEGCVLVIWLFPGSIYVMRNIILWWVLLPHHFRCFASDFGRSKRLTDARKEIPKTFTKEK